MSQRLVRLEAESAIRHLAARYMALCDEPATDAAGPCFENLFTSDVVWEGIGRKASSEFDRVEGRNALIAWFDSMRVPPKYAFNVHFLTSEAISVTEDRGRGTWVMLQLALRTTGEGELRIARVTIQFREVNQDWRISHFQTESLRRHDLPAGQIAAWVGQMET
ncbi:MAG: nuclear transport factor 2 family protein [Novosphingobium sp.]